MVKILSVSRPAPARGGKRHLLAGLIEPSPAPDVRGLVIHDVRVVGKRRSRWDGHVAEWPLTWHEQKVRRNAKRGIVTYTRAELTMRRVAERQLKASRKVARLTAHLVVDGACKLCGTRPEDAPTKRCAVCSILFAPQEEAPRVEG